MNLFLRRCVKLNLLLQNTVWRGITHAADNCPKTRNLSPLGIAAYRSALNFFAFLRNSGMWHSYELQFFTIVGRRKVVS